MTSIGSHSWHLIERSRPSSRRKKRT